MKHGQCPLEVRGERAVMISVGCVNDRSAGVCRRSVQGRGSGCVEDCGRGVVGLYIRGKRKGVCRKLSFGGFAWGALSHPNNSQ